MPVEILRQIPEDATVELSNVVRQYKQCEQVWQDWACAGHIRQENLIDSFGFNYLIKLFEQRCANTDNLPVPETVILSLVGTIEGRRRARDVYSKYGIPDTGRHDHPIVKLEEIYKLATTSQSATKPRTSNDVELVAETNDPGNVSSSLPPDDESDIQRNDVKLSITIDSGISENNSAQLSVLPGLLMDEIIKCIEEVEERWNIFFRPGRPGNLVSTALVTCAADDCLRSLICVADLLFTEDEKYEFARLAQYFEEKWAKQWSVNKSANNKELSKHGVKQKSRKKKSKPNQNPAMEAPFELTEVLSHKALSAAIFVPIPSTSMLQTTSKLDNFRNALTIHLWHLAAVNLADDGYAVFKGAAIRHAYARSYQKWLANKSIRDLALKRTSPDPSLRRIDCAIQLCHDRLEQCPNLTINPWLLGYLIAVHHGTSELSFRRFTATNYTSSFGLLALQFVSMQEGQECYPCLYEYTRTGRIGGSASLLGALFGRGQYRRADYRPSTNVKTLGVDFLRDIDSAALLKRQLVDWWVELAATRSFIDGKLDDNVNCFDIFERHCRRYEEIFAVPELQFGFPLDPADGVEVVDVAARDRTYQRQWTQELGGTPEPAYEVFFQDQSEESLMQHAGIPLGDRLKIREHLQRAGNCLFSLEFAVYSVKMGDEGFAYTLGEPPRVGKDFQSLRTATYVVPRELVGKRRDSIQHVGVVRQSRKIIQSADAFLRKQKDRAIPDKNLVLVDSTFAHDEQAESQLRAMDQGQLAERPSKFLLAFKTIEAVLMLLYRNYRQRVVSSPWDESDGETGTQSLG